MELQVVHHTAPAELPAGLRILYQLEERTGELCTGPVAVPAGTLAFELVEAGGDGALLHAPVELDAGEERLLRLDRVDFPPGGVAYLHRHEGPGIRVLLEGTIEITTNGSTHRYAPLEAWFESGPDPVYAAASASVPTAFVRCMVLPRRLLGKSSITYLRDEDQDKPKPQRYTRYVDEPIELRVRR